MTHLIVNNKFGIFVEHRVLALGQRHEGFEHPLGMYVRWRGVMQAIGFANDGVDIQRISVMEEILSEGDKLIGTMVR